MAAFDAALEAVRSGNAGDAKQAAIDAAAETRAAWEVALDAVELADTIASEAIQESAGTTADVGIAEVQRLQDEVEDRPRRNSHEMTRVATQEAWHSAAIQASISAIEGRSVSVNVSHHTRYSSSGSSGEGPS